MTKKQFRARLRLLIVLMLVLLGLITFASGKYVSDLSFNGKVTFTAKLADSVVLQEHTAQRQTDGSYKLVEPYVSENTYYLIPGLDIPKDPHIIITGKTPIPAYLFVEVVDTLDTKLEGSEKRKPVNYNVADHWVVLEGVTGTDGGKVYYYDTVLTNTNVPNSISILNGNTITISQYLLSQSADDGTDILKFNVKLIEKVGDATAETAYKGYPVS